MSRWVRGTSAGSLSRKWGSTSWYPAKTWDCHMLGAVNTSSPGVNPGASAVHHLADALVTGIAGHQRKLVGVPSHVDDVEVAPADGRQVGPHQDLARPRVRDRRLDALYTLGARLRAPLASLAFSYLRLMSFDARILSRGGAVVKPVDPRFRRTCIGLTLLTDGNTISRADSREAALHGRAQRSPRRYTCL